MHQKHKSTHLMLNSLVIIMVHVKLFLGYQMTKREREREREELLTMSSHLPLCLCYSIFQLPPHFLTFKIFGSVFKLCAGKVLLLSIVFYYYYYYVQFLFVIKLHHQWQRFHKVIILSSIWSIDPKRVQSERVDI